MIPMQTPNVINISLFSFANVNTGIIALPRKSHSNSVDVIGSSENCSGLLELFTIRIIGNQADIDMRYTPSDDVKIR